MKINHSLYMPSPEQRSTIIKQNKEHLCGWTMGEKVLTFLHVFVSQSTSTLDFMSKAVQQHAEFSF